MGGIVWTDPSQHSQQQQKLIQVPTQDTFEKLAESKSFMLNSSMQSTDF